MKFNIVIYAAALAIAATACSGGDKVESAPNNVGLQFVVAKKDGTLGFLAPDGNFVGNLDPDQMPQHDGSLGLVVNGMFYAQKQIYEVGVFDLYTVDNNGNASKVMSHLADCGYMSDDLVPTVRMGGHIVYRDRSGNPKFKLDSVGGKEVRMAGSHFSEGVSWFKDEAGNIGLINTAGKVVAMAGNDPTWRIPAAARNGMIIIPSGETDNIVLDLSGKKLFSIPNAEQTAIVGDSIIACRLDPDKSKYELDEAGFDVPVIRDTYSLDGELRGSEVGNMKAFNGLGISIMTLFQDTILSRAALDPELIVHTKPDMSQYYALPCSWNKALGLDQFMASGDSGLQSASEPERILALLFTRLNCPFNFKPFEETARKIDAEIEFAYSPLVVCYPKMNFSPAGVTDGYFTPADKVMLIDGVADCSLDMVTFNLSGNTTVKPFLDEYKDDDYVNPDDGKVYKGRDKKHIYVACNYMGQQQSFSYDVTERDGYYVMKYFAKVPNAKLESYYVSDDAVAVETKNDSERSIPRFDESGVVKN